MSWREKYRVPLGAGRPKLCCTVALCAEIQKLICFSSVLLPPLGILPDLHCPRYPLTNTSYCLCKLIQLCLQPKLNVTARNVDYRSVLWNGNTPYGLHTWHLSTQRTGLTNYVLLWRQHLHLHLLTNIFTFIWSMRLLFNYHLKKKPKPNCQNR